MRSFRDPVIFVVAVGGFRFAPRRQRVIEAPKPAKELTLAIDANKGDPLAFVFFETNARNAGPVILVRLSVTAILGIANDTKVGNRVIQRIMIDMVDMAVWPSPIDNHPCEAMRKILSAEYADNTIPFFIQTTRWLTGPPLVPYFVRPRAGRIRLLALFPSKFAGLTVVFQESGDFSTRQTFTMAGEGPGNVRGVKERVHFAPAGHEIAPLG